MTNQVMGKVMVVGLEVTAFWFVAVATGFPFAAIAEPTSSSQPSSEETMSETPGF